MIDVIVNGKRVEAPEASTVLDVLRAAGEAVPTLCHDDRLQPKPVCRICLVEIEGHERFATACAEPVVPGMRIRTESAALEAARRAGLEMLATMHPASTGPSHPETPFSRLLDRYQVKAEAVPADGSEPAHCVDTSHPYMTVDMSQCIYCNRCVRICAEVQGQFVWKDWNRGHHMRIWPDGAQTLLESSCVSCGACADTCPTGAIADRAPSAPDAAPVRWTRTVCPYCGVGCEVTAGVNRENRIVQMLPVIDSPVNKGHLCVKGRYAFDFTHSDERVLHPMIRQADGAWLAVSWDTALDEVSQRFRQVVADHGPGAAGVLGSARATNEENYLAQKFARVVLGTNNVDCCARVCHAPSAAAMRYVMGTGAATSAFDDIELASTILVCGANVTENHPVVGARIKQAVLRGARLIVIDPRAIELTSLAAFHLALRPGTNIALLHALAHVIVTENLVDAEFLAGRVEGLAEFMEFVREYTPERAEVETGVPADRIRGAARLYATSRPSIMFHGLGMTEHHQGTTGVGCLVNLALLTGNVGRPGSGVNPLRGQNNVQGSAHMGCEPGGLTGLVPIREGREDFERHWQVKLPAERGLNLLEMMDAADNGQFRALWVIGYDLLPTLPNMGGTEQSLSRLDFLVVQDLFMTETAARFAHVFLPAASAFEKDGTFMNSERRVQRIRTVVDPPGESRPDWRIICDLAARMGHRERFAFESPEAVWNEIRSVWPAGGGITYSRLDSAGLQWPCPDEDHPGTVRLHGDRFAKRQTADLQRVPYVPTREAASDEFPFLLITGRTLHQFNAGTMTMRTPNRLLRSTDTLDMTASDAARLRLAEGDPARIESRYGTAVLPVRINSNVKPGEVFATFHVGRLEVNRLTSTIRDGITSAPEYKVTAVRIRRAEA